MNGIHGHTVGDSVTLNNVISSNTKRERHA